MNNQLKITRPARFASALAGFLLVASAVSSLGQILPPSSLPYGYSYEEWSAKWWQFFLGQSTNHLESIGDPGICRGPASRVRFLSPPPGGGIVTRKAIIPGGTPLFFPILAFAADNTACPVTAFSSLTADQLAVLAEGGWNSAATLTTCTIDGVAVPGLEDPTNSIYNVVSPAFSYTTAEFGNDLALIEGEPCIPGSLTIYPAVADGDYLMIAPLAPGKHTIHFVGIAGPLATPFLEFDITYQILVVPDFDRDDR